MFTRISIDNRLRNNYHRINSSTYQKSGWIKLIVLARIGFRSETINSKVRRVDKFKIKETCLYTKDTCTKEILKMVKQM